MVMNIGKFFPYKRKRIFICGCEEAVSLRVNKTKTNPGRPYFVCWDRDGRFLQWADDKLTKKNKEKQAKQYYWKMPLFYWIK